MGKSELLNKVQQGKIRTLKCSLLWEKPKRLNATYYREVNSFKVVYYRKIKIIK